MILRLTSSATRMLFESTLNSTGESIENFNVTLEVDNIATIKDLIRKDMGVSILPRSACMDELRKKKITALPIENLSMHNLYFWKTNEEIQASDQQANDGTRKFDIDSLTYAFS